MENVQAEKATLPTLNFYKLAATDESQPVKPNNKNSPMVSDFNATAKVSTKQHDIKNQVDSERMTLDFDNVEPIEKVNLPEAPVNDSSVPNTWTILGKRLRHE